MDAVRWFLGIRVSDILRVFDAVASPVRLHIILFWRIRNLLFWPEIYLYFVNFSFNSMELYVSFILLALSPSKPPMRILEWKWGVDPAGSVSSPVKLFRKDKIGERRRDFSPCFSEFLSEVVSMFKLTWPAWATGTPGELGLLFKIPPGVGLVGTALDAMSSSWISYAWPSATNFRRTLRTPSSVTIYYDKSPFLADDLGDFCEIKALSVNF